MEFSVNIGEYSPEIPVAVGNVYPMRGGRGASLGHLQVLIAIAEGNLIQGPSCLFMIITKEGKPKGVSSYALHYVEKLCPVGFVPGLDGLNLEVGSI